MRLNPSPMHLSRRTLISVAAVLYVISLVAPVGGRWLGGLGLMIVSIFGAVVMTGSLFSVNELSLAQQAKGLLTLSLPAYNLLIIYGLIALRREDYVSPDWFKGLTLVAGFVAAYFVLGLALSPNPFNAPKTYGIFLILTVWLAALLMVTIAAWLPAGGRRSN